MRWITLRPASAKNSSGMATPIANETVSSTVSMPIRPVDPATMMAASTGPAHGTNTAPSASPTPKPLRAFDTSRCGIQEKGFSRIRSKRGTISPTPISTSTAMPTHRRMSCGRLSAPMMSEPARVTIVKLVTSPRITRYGTPAGRRRGSV